MLSPSTSALGWPPTKLLPRMNACASPSGLGCTQYEIEMPHCEPSPSSASKRGTSCGVLIRRMSRIPASISVLSG
jgi:hypothetical protein